MEMLKEEVTLDGVKTMPYEQWHLLRKENMPKEEGKQNPINNFVEDLLMNVLWKAPEEE